MVSGESFLRGAQASPLSFSLSAAFWIAQEGLGGRSKEEEGSLAEGKKLSSSDSRGSGLVCWKGDRGWLVEDECRDGCWEGSNAWERGAKTGAVEVKERMNRLGVVRVQLIQVIVVVVVVVVVVDIE